MKSAGGYLVPTSQTRWWPPTSGPRSLSARLLRPPHRPCPACGRPSHQRWPSPKRSRSIWSERDARPMQSLLRNFTRLGNAAKKFCRTPVHVLNFSRVIYFSISSDFKRARSSRIARPSSLSSLICPEPAVPRPTPRPRPLPHTDARRPRSP